MNYSADIEPSSSNNWKTVNALFEQVFGPDPDLSNKTNATEVTTVSLTSDHNSRPSYALLNNLDPCQPLNEETKISCVTYKDAIDELHLPISDTSQTPDTQSSETCDNIMRYQAISPPFHIPNLDLPKIGKNMIRPQIFNINFDNVIS